MSFIAASIIGSAAIGAVGSMVSGNAQKKAVQSQNAANERLWREQNAANRQLQQEQLQRIFGGREGTLRDDIFGLRGQLDKIYAPAAAEMESAYGIYDPMLANRDQFVGGVFGGRDLTERLGYLSPVAQERMRGVEGLSDSVRNSYQQLRGQRAAQFARQGFVGGGSYADRLGRSDLIGMNTDISNLRSGAMLQNAMDTRALQEDDKLRRIQLLGAPYEMFSQRIGVQDAMRQARLAGATGGMNATMDQLGRYASLLPPMIPVGGAPAAQAAYNPGPGQALQGIGSTLASYTMMKYGAQEQAKRDMLLADLWKAPGAYTAGATAPNAVPSPGNAFSSGGWCWVARSAFGVNNPRWLEFRSWIMNDAPKWLSDIYGRNGPRWAAWLDAHPSFKPAVRLVMNTILRHSQRHANRI